MAGDAAGRVRVPGGAADPPEDGETLMDLLHRELGAYLIGTG